MFLPAGSLSLSHARNVKSSSINRLVSKKIKDMAKEGRKCAQMLLHFVQFFSILLYFLYRSLSFSFQRPKRRLAAAAPLAAALFVAATTPPAAGEEDVGAEAAALATFASAAEEEEKEPAPAPGEAAAADLAELVWNETCSRAERNEGCESAAAAAADDDDDAEEAPCCCCCCALEDEKLDDAREADAAAAAATLRGHADADAPADAAAEAPFSSSSMVAVGGTSGRTNAPAERRGIAMPSPMRKPSVEGEKEKALEAEREASLARRAKGEGARGAAVGAFEDEDDGEASADGAGRRMAAGRTNNGMVVGKGLLLLF